MEEKNIDRLNKLKRRMVKRAQEKGNNLLDEEVLKISQEVDKEVLKCMFKVG